MDRLSAKNRTICWQVFAQIFWTFAFEKLFADPDPEFETKELDLAMARPRSEKVK